MRRDPIVRALPLFLSSILLASCSADAPRAPAPATGEEDLIGGTDDRGDPAVLALVTFDGTSNFLGCTGTLIAPRTVLTAAHCAETPPAGSTEYAFFGDVMPATVDNRFVAIDRRVPNPRWNANDTNTDDDDIAVYALAQAVTDVAPIELFEPAVTSGESIRHVGFGSTTAANVAADGSGSKREMTTTVRQVAGQIEVGGPGRGHCYGDSGGPGLIVPAGGTREQVEGVVSWGSDDCLTESWDTRVDTHVAWIRQTMSAWETVMPAPDAGTLPPPPDSGPDAGPLSPPDSGVKPAPPDSGACTTCGEPDAGFHGVDAGPPVPGPEMGGARADHAVEGTISGSGCNAVGGARGDQLLFGVMLLATAILSGRRRSR